jgi:hypothetical protein
VRPQNIIQKDKSKPEGYCIVNQTMNVELTVEKDDSVLHFTIANCSTVFLLQKLLHSRSFCVKVTKISGVIPNTVWLSHKSLKENTKLVWAPHTFRVVLFNPTEWVKVSWKRTFFEIATLSMIFVKIRACHNHTRECHNHTHTC